MPETPSQDGGFPNINLGGETIEKARIQRSIRPNAPAKSEPIYRMATSTDTNWLLTGLIAVGASVLFLLAMIPIRDMYFGELFLKRGFVPYFMVFLMAWAGAILVLKWFKIAEQKSAMLVDVLPTEISEDITFESIDEFVQNSRKLPETQQRSFLVNRVLRGLEHFRIRRNATEVAGLLASQSEIDANSVMSSYAMLRVFIWAIPILGFIGTVLGISDAVGGFSGTLHSAGDISALKDSLNSVTGGLATAFDTTLVALVMSLIIKFPMASMQKAEDSLLNWVDEYCNENLIRRLKDNRESPLPAGPDGTPDVAAQIERAMAVHQNELKTWNEKLQAIHTNLQKSSVTTAESLQRQMMTVQKGLEGLSDVLAKLGQQQVIVQPVEKRGWFSRKNQNGN